MKRRRPRPERRARRRQVLRDDLGLDFDADLLTWSEDDIDALSWSGDINLIGGYDLDLGTLSLSVGELAGMVLTLS